MCVTLIGPFLFLSFERFFKIINIFSIQEVILFLRFIMSIFYSWTIVPFSYMFIFICSSICHFLLNISTLLQLFDNVFRNFNWTGGLYLICGSIITRRAANITGLNGWNFRNLPELRICSPAQILYNVMIFTFGVNTVTT